jgi:CBS domain-containing protein
MELLKIVRTPPIVAKPMTTVFEAAVQMAGQRVGAIVVVNPENRVLGIFTERDNLFRVTCQKRDPKETILSDVMSSPVITVTPDIDADEALATMIRHRLRHLPVVDSAKRIVGMASVRHLLLHRVGEQKAGMETLAAYVSAGGPG